MSKLLELKRARLAELIKPEVDAIAAAEAASRDLTPEESEVVVRTAQNPDVIDLRASIKVLEDADARKAQSASVIPAGLGGAVVRSEPMTYRKSDRRTSYFRDLGLAHVGHDPQAQARLARHRDEMAVELPKAESRLRKIVLGDDDAGEAALRQLEGVATRDITRVDGAGGEFVPPLWILSEYAEMLRAGRVAANLVRSIPLPGGTDSINIPRITTGTSTAAQTADNGAVSETDIVTTSVAGPVRTIAGQQDVALQLLEQSPLVFDEIIFSDLTADYNQRLDVQVLNGSGSSGQHTGFYTLSGSTSVSYTDASPTIPEFWPSGAQVISQTITARKQNVDCFIMHPRRWYWMAGGLDSSNRPYITPQAAGPYNAIATVDNPGIAEGPVGTWHGLPVYLDMNTPVLFTAGTGAAGTEDAILCIRRNDHLLFEGALRSRALPEVLSGNLTVRLQVYAYSAFICGRMPSGVGKVIGTGLTAPSGY